MKFSEYEQLRFERRDNGVLLITMDRPDKYNAADEQMHGELARVWAEVSADPENESRGDHRRGQGILGRRRPGHGSLGGWPG